MEPQNATNAKTASSGGIDTSLKDQVVKAILSSAPVHHREIWFSPARFEHFAQHSFLSKKLSPCLDQLSWLDVEKRSRTSTENAVQNHGKIDVFVATTWWWKFPHWFKKSETRY